MEKLYTKKAYKGVSKETTYYTDSIMKLDPGFGWKYSDYSDAISKFRENGYHVTSFADFLKSSNLKHLILRHDVDFNFVAAYKMAKVDYEMDISSSFFFRVCANGYNLSSAIAIPIIKEISEMGHELGLHLDSGMEKIWECTVEESIARQFDIFYNSTGIQAKGFSIHMPSTLGGIDNCDLIVSDLNLAYHAYEKRFTEGEFKYISDSMKMWREKPISDYINKVNKIQLLIHPIWWYQNNPQENF